MSGTGIEISPDMDPEAVLAHYGVKGMQWGKRKATDDASGGSQSTSSKPSNDEVKTARSNLQRKALDYNVASREAKKSGPKGSVVRALAKEKVREMKVDFLNDPDRITASYLTKGEKIIFGVLAASTGPIGVGAVGGNIAGRAMSRKSIENKQRSGAYYK